MTSYYVVQNGEKAGPFEEAEILRRIEEGGLRPDDLCWREGMADWQPIATVLSVASRKSSPPPIPSAPTHAVQQVPPLFLHIPVGRLILMSIVSFSAYEMYWIYKNWRYVKERDKLNIRPFWRGWFGIFNCHSLLRRIYEDKEARSVEVPSFSPSALATGWVVLIIISNLISRAHNAGFCSGRLQ